MSEAHSFRPGATQNHARQPADACGSPAGNVTVQPSARERHEVSFAITEVAQRVRTWRHQGLTVALCHGCFDPLHIGHVDHFREAASYADRLVVTVTADRFVAKGEGRPVFDQNARARMVDAIRFVDAVAINDWANAIATLECVRPNIFVKGIDYAGPNSSAAFAAEREAALRLGIEVCFTRSAKESATALLHRLAVISRSTPPSEEGTDRCGIPHLSSRLGAG
ncbi:MAG: hypothetical protein E6G97_21595 [Alphaproteobacteria bacterium]|nr:MAG: hypothetical protein E6G97_21595 [Alphaproteobacteria bacterium]